MFYICILFGRRCSVHANMKDFGLVSIVTASYNSAGFIAETIESIIAQTYTNWELLICDDFSTDNTVQIIQDYAEKDSRIRLFVLSKNSGAGVSRNKAISESKGNYIAFCDSDDRWKPYKLEKQLEYMEEKKCQVCYSSYLLCKEENNSLCGVVFCAPKYTYRNICHNGSVGFSTCIYKTTNIGRILLPSMRKRQDWALKILLIKNGGTAYGIREPLVYYRVRSNSLSRKKLTLIKYNIQVYREVLNYGWLHAWLVFLFCFTPRQIVHNWKVRLENLFLSRKKLAKL